MERVRSVALTLPLEMQHEIALQCDRSDLARLARVHSAWTTACEAVLYESVSTAISLFDPCTVELLRTLATGSSKVKRVRSFSVTFPLGVIDPDFGFVTEGRHTSLPPLPSLYCDVLSQMNNLATLRVPSIVTVGLENIKFIEAVLEIIQAGNFKLKSLVLPEELDERLLSTLDKALALHIDTFRCLGVSFDDHSLTSSRDRWDRLSRFATRYSVFATSGSSDIQLYPVLDASSPMWNSELYVQNIHRATYTRGDLKGSHLTVTFLQRCYSVVPRLLQYLETSFPVIRAFTFTLLHRALDYYAIDYPSSSDIFPAWEAIIGALASFNCQVTTLAFIVRCESAGISGDLGLELTREEESMLLRLIGNRCSSVQEVTLPDGTKYRRDPNAEEGWSREYIADVDTDWERDNWFHDDLDDTDSDPYEGYEFYGSDWFPNLRI